MGMRRRVVNSRRKRSTRPDEFHQPVPTRSPERQSVQIPPSSSYGGYPPAARDYGYYGQQPPVKRHRTSIDYGRQQGLYDVDGRMARQMDPYGQPTAAMYAGQPAAYQTPAAMQTYNTGQVVPDYTAVRTPNPIL